MKFSITEIDSNDPGAMLRAAGLLTALAAALGGAAGTVPLAAGAPMPPTPLDPADNPSAGVDVGAPGAFGENPVEAFGNVAGPAVPYIESAETATAPIPPALIDQARAEVAFGEQGNAPPVAGSPGITAPGTASLPPAPPPAPSNTGAPATAELDKNGLPWDARIHASSKARNADKTWRGKRGVDPAVVAQVEAELRALMAVPGPGVGNLTPDQVAANHYVPTPAAGNVAPPSPGLPPAPPAPPAPTHTIAPTAPGITPPPAAGAAPLTFVSLMGKVTALTTGGKLTEAEALSAIQANSLSAFPQLLQRPDLLKAVSDTIDSLVATKG